jgi:predicted NAD/FAD-binding protein
MCHDSPPSHKRFDAFGGWGRSKAVNERLRIAIIGGGAAGLSAAHVLARRHQVTLFEREPQLGGHVQTFVVNDGPDTGLALDMAFMLLSDRHYPTFKRLLAQLGIDVATGDMSFGYDAPLDGIQYVINWRADDPFTRSTNLREGGSADRRDAPMGRLFEPALRFCFQAPRDLRSGFLVGKTLTEYCRARGFPEELLTHYLGPLGAVGWSLPPSSIEAFPAELYVSFFDHHDLFTLTGGAVWQFIPGGAVRYVQALAMGLPGRIELAARDLRVRRDDEGVTVQGPGRADERFDHLVVATHADQALELLLDPSDDERRLLSAWKYRHTRCILHTDRSVMPADQRLWASWNYRRQPEAPDCTPGYVMTYHLNRVLGHVNAARQYFMTHGTARIAPEHVLREVSLTHPIFTAESVAARDAIGVLNGARRTHYCGSYLGYSFHEDAVRSGIAVAEAFGLTL